MSVRARVHPRVAEVVAMSSKKIPEKATPPVPLPDVCMRTPNGARPLSVDYEVMRALISLGSVWFFYWLILVIIISCLLAVDMLRPIGFIYVAPHWINCLFNLDLCHSGSIWPSQHLEKLTACRSCKWQRRLLLNEACIYTSPNCRM